MTKEQIQEYTLRIINANRSQLVVIYYDMILDYIKESEYYLASKDFKAYQKAIEQARRCMNGLVEGLDFKYNISHNLFQLYLYMEKELVKAGIQRNADPLTHVTPIISSLREAFFEIGKQDDSKTLMGNTQSIYAGLTYGKSQLMENLDVSDQSRGFRV